MIAKVLNEVKKMFPRARYVDGDEKDPEKVYSGLGWEFPKFHSMTQPPRRPGGFVLVKSAQLNRELW